jgi:hypothetical protein
MLDTQWQIPPIFPIPDWFLEILDSYTEDYPGLYVAQLLWGRGIQDAKTLNLAQQGVTLIVTCDTGSTNLEEINYAHGLGIDIIVTNHHTLADKRPQVVALINAPTLNIY